MRSPTVSDLEQRIKEARTFRCDLLLVYNDLTDAAAENDIPKILTHLKALERNINKLKRVLNSKA